MRVDRLQVLILVLVVSVSVFTGAYAAVSSTWNTSNRVRVTASSLGVYQDAALSQPASNSIDWGVMSPGGQVSVNWWVRNEGGNALTLSWSSDLESNSVNGYLGDNWGWSDGTNWHDLNGYSLGAGVVLATKYTVIVSMLTPAGTYSWGLTMRGA